MGMITRVRSFSRRRPATGSTEEIGWPKIDEIEYDIPERVDGVEKRDLNVVDTTEGPKLAVAEWSKLVTCERPCSKEEWEITSVTDKWETLHVLKFAFHRPKEVGIEEPIEKGVTTTTVQIGVVPPRSRTHPPRLPPSTLGNGRMVERGEAKG